MKNYKLIFWAVALLALALLVFARTIPAGSVTGTITPRGSATQVWLFSGSDTIRAGVQNDIFDIANAKAGSYTLVVDPSPTYKPNSKTGVVVRDGEITNVGEIIMEQIKTSSQ
jgi:hypothetical protein